MALTGSLKCSVGLSNSLTTVDLSIPSESVNETVQKDISSGRLYHDTVALGISEAYSIDVGNASLDDVFGSSISLAVVTGIYIKANINNTVDLTIVDGTNSMLNELPPISPGEGLSLLMGIDVSTDSKLYITNGAAVGAVDVIITGTE